LIGSASLAMLGASSDTYFEWLWRLPEEHSELRSLDVPFFLDFLLEGDDTFYYVNTTLLPTMAVRELLLKQLLVRLARDEDLAQLDPEKLRLADYPSDAALVMRRLLEVDAPLGEDTLRCCSNHHTEFLLLAAACLAGRGAEFLALRLEVAAVGWPVGWQTSLSVLHGLRRCGCRFGPHDSDVAKAVAFWQVEAQNWRGYLEDGSYEEKKCCIVIKRYEQRLAFIHDWGCALQREARVLVRILSGASLNGSGRLPHLVAHRVAAFAVWELAVGAPEAWPEPTDGAAADNEDVDQRDSVIDEIVHEEPPAYIDPEVAHTTVQLEADERWVDQVERGLQERRDEVVAASPVRINESQHDETPIPSEKVYMLRFGCNDTEGFRRMLLDGPHLHACRDAMQISGHPCVLPSGALIFVMPDQYRDTCQALNGVELHPFHIVIAESFEDDLQDALDSLPCKKRPREKARDRRELVLQTSMLDGSSGRIVGQGDEIYFDLVCKWTFLCFAPRPKSADQVAQSSTEVVGNSSTHYGHSRGLNPRRLILADPD